MSAPIRMYQGPGSAFCTITAVATATSTQTGMRVYAQTAPTQALHPSSINMTGGNQPHSNFQPYLCVNFVISLFGIFPSQT